MIERGGGLRRHLGDSSSVVQSRGVTWLDPTQSVELTYSEVMEGRLRDPVYRGIV